MREKCNNPCPGSCDAGAQCSVINHTPICTCPEGYTGDPFTNCFPKPPSTEPIQEADPCNPSPCGPNAQCRDGVCTCLPECQGDPYSGCRPECVLNTDCPRDKACIRNKCEDPCPGTCRQGAICDVINHIPVCSCPNGMSGNPFVQCLPMQVMPGLVIVTRPIGPENELYSSTLTNETTSEEAAGIFFPSSGVETVFLRLYNSAFGDVNHYKDIYINSTKGLFDFTSKSGYNISRKSIFYIHGYTKSAATTTQVPEAFLSKHEYNVFSVDWSELAQLPYTFAVQRMKVRDVFGQATGYALAEFLNLAMSVGVIQLSDINLVGHSLGAHLSGYIGRNLINKPPVIIGLDPAGPEFYTGFFAAKLTKSDADIVYYIQTNMALVGFGLALSLGKANYIFNFPALVQPGCESVSCSHNRAVEYYAEAVKYPRNMVAIRCDSVEDYKDDKCGSSISNLGFPVDKRSEGIYYLETKPTKPFGLGITGIKSLKIFLQ